MIIQTKTNKERVDEIDRWNLWFAWHPLFLDGHIVWLEHIERRPKVWPDEYGGMIWEYRLSPHLKAKKK